MNKEKTKIYLAAQINAKLIDYFIHERLAPDAYLRLVIALTDEIFERWIPNEPSWDDEESDW